MKSYHYLPHINFPEDLRKFKIEELPLICKELRADIINECALNPGHLASSLGVVELTVALHYVFNTPDDLLVWDVGHQAYGHKILTGRRETFCTNRKLGGIRPFPSPLESPYDTFTCGHASNSISAALGMAVTTMLKGENRHVVAIIGDGAMSGGLAFEGLNNVSEIPNNMLIILNDNDMSIDNSVGGLREYLLKLHTGRFYNNLRLRISKVLRKYGWLNNQRIGAVLRFNNSLKSLVMRQQNIFEGLNIRYFGPTDGHNVIELVDTLQRIKEMKGPKILHLHTIKGKGLKPAEAFPTVWHAPGKFDPISGERITTTDKNTPPKFQDVFGETLLELAKQDEKIVGVTPAMPTGCSMNIMMKVFPKRTFDVGIAEGHAMTFSAGMAKEGYIPYCNIYSSFAQRAFDNIIHDAAILNLHVVLCLDRAGIVGEDGPTHHGAFDMAALRIIPNITIASPFDECELRRLMYTAHKYNGLFVIRYPRGNGRKLNWKCPLEEISIGTGRKIKDGKQVAIITIGPIGNVAADAILSFENKHPDKKIALYDLRFLKPLDEKLLHEIGEKYSHIITIEDGIKAGGMGSAILEWMNQHNFHPSIDILGIPDKFIEHGSVAALYKKIGLDEPAIVRHIQAAFNK